MGAVAVGVAASAQVGQHGESAGKGERAIGTMAVGEGPAGELADEAGNLGEVGRQRSGVGKTLVAARASAGGGEIWNFKCHKGDFGAFGHPTRG